MPTLARDRIKSVSSWSMAQISLSLFLIPSMRSRIANQTITQKPDTIKAIRAMPTKRAIPIRVIGASRFHTTYTATA
jgi:hypothetical protein